MDDQKKAPFPYPHLSKLLPPEAPAAAPAASDNDRAEALAALPKMRALARSSIIADLRRICDLCSRVLVEDGRVKRRKWTALDIDEVMLIVARVKRSTDNIEAACDGFTGTLQAAALLEHGALGQQPVRMLESGPDGPSAGYQPAAYGYPDGIVAVHPRASMTLDEYLAQPGDDDDHDL